MRFELQCAWAHCSAPAIDPAMQLSICKLPVALLLPALALGGDVGDTDGSTTAQAANEFGKAPEEFSLAPYIMGTIGCSVFVVGLCLGYYKFMKPREEPFEETDELELAPPHPKADVKSGQTE
mmetsp:Transcript_5925/g.4645  ORF Transcript_5925/g.4645 Transcript_5925/m.4645 type:complete len:123 (-) Transcript_5925:114-482(-)